MFTIGSRFLSKTDRDVAIRPEWCAEGDLTEEGHISGWTCLFWQKPDTAYYTSSSKGHPQSPVIRSDGSLGPMPSITETSDVTFKSKLDAGLVVRQIRKQGVTVSLVVGGEINGKWEGNVARFQRKDWDENDSVTLNMMGGTFILKAIRPNEDAKPEAVSVKIVEPPKKSQLGSLSAEDQKKFLELLLKAAKQLPETEQPHK